MTDRQYENIVTMIRELRDRIVRIETRIVVLANEAGLGHVFDHSSAQQGDGNERSDSD